MATGHGGNTAYPEVKNKAFHLPCEIEKWSGNNSSPPDV